MALIRPQSDFDRIATITNFWDSERYRTINAYVPCLPCPCLAPELGRKMAGEWTGAIVCQEEQVP